MADFAITKTQEKKHAEKSNIVENLSIARYRSSLYLAIDKKE